MLFYNFLSVKLKNKILKRIKSAATFLAKIIIFYNAFSVKLNSNILRRFKSGGGFSCQNNDIPGIFLVQNMNGPWKWDKGPCPIHLHAKIKILIGHLEKFIFSSNLNICLQQNGHQIWHRETGLSPPVKYFTDCSKAVLLLWIICVIYVLCLSYFCICSLLHFNHLLWNGLTSCLWNLIVFLLLSLVVSCVRCGACLDWFLIFAAFPTLNS